ncbi:MAG: ATP-binding protein, partial [Anaerolineales bacterium]|jgi:signal transduction histidine kinase
MLLTEEVPQQSQETVIDVRRLVHGLRPPALDQLGLVEAVRDFVRQKGEAKSTWHVLMVDITSSLDGLPVLPAVVEVNAYRIVLEALSNVIRHAQAERCKVKFQLEEDDLNQVVLRLQISDDGSGIPYKNREGVSLSSMRARAEEIGGKFTIEQRQRVHSNVVKGN